MVEIKRFGKFLPHDTKIKVYHGSRKLFTRFSNEFNRTGNGKNVFGWGIYYFYIDVAIKQLNV